MAVNFTVKLPVSISTDNRINEISPYEWELMITTYLNLKEHLNNVKTHETHDTLAVATLKQRYERDIKEQKHKYEKNIENLKESIKTLQDAANVAAQESRDKVERKADEYHERFELKRKQIEDMAAQNAAKHYENIIDIYKKQNKIIPEINKLSQILEPVIKHYSGTNSEKGASGEQTIYNMLLSNDSYRDALIIDTSNTTASGDIRFKWRKLNCLIEIKNKQTITKNDIDKFARDITANSIIASDTTTRDASDAEDRAQMCGKVNCAIFCSLRTDVIPAHTRDVIQLDFINGCPVIYLFAPPPSKEINYAITFLDKLLSTMTIKGTINNQLISHFKNFYNHIIIYQLYFTKTINMKQKEIKQLTKHLNTFDKLFNDATPLYTNLASHDPAKHDPAKHDPLSKYITDTMVNYILDYYNNYQRYPTKINLITKNIIPKTIFDKIELPIIINYCTK